MTEKSEQVDVARSSSSDSDSDRSSDFDSIVDGLDYSTFELLPGTMNARPGMKFVDDYVVPFGEEEEDVTYEEDVYPLDDTQVYYYDYEPPQWTTQFVLTTPQTDEKKKKKKKKKRNKNKQRRLERLQAMQKSTEVPTKDSVSPRNSQGVEGNLSPTLESKRKKRNKQRRRGSSFSDFMVSSLAGSGRIRRESHPLGGSDDLDLLEARFGGLGLHYDQSGALYSNPILHYPMRSSPPFAPAKHPFSSSLLRAPLWVPHPVPIYAQAC